MTSLKLHGRLWVVTASLYWGVWRVQLEKSSVTDLQGLLDLWGPKSLSTERYYMLSESFGHQRVEAFVLTPTHPLVVNGRGLSITFGQY